MDGAGGNVHSVTGPVGASLATLREGHLAFQNDMCSFGGMRVVRIESARAILPHIGLGESFAVKLGFEFPDVCAHAEILAANQAALKKSSSRRELIQASAWHKEANLFAQGGEAAGCHSRQDAGPQRNRRTVASSITGNVIGLTPRGPS